MIDNPLATIFGFIGSFFGLVLPLGLVFLVGFLFLVSSQAAGSKPKAIGDAIYTYAMHGLSVLLMTTGALPTIFSVFAGVAYTGRTYIALLLVFAAGGLLFLMQDQVVRNLDDASKAIPEAIYMTVLKLVGNGLVILSALSIFLSIVLASFTPGWWVTPFILLLYGLLLSWCTREDQDLEFLKSFQLAPEPKKRHKKSKKRR